MERVGREPGAEAGGAIGSGELKLRLTIERLRALVLMAGILLVAALVGFLAIGKWRNPFNRRDLPQRLGIEIQQEENGVTYTQARGGHTLFRIHASKVVQLKQGNAMLHEVKIELFGADGSRVDRIEGSEFEYDRKNETARATGPVEITLMRPGVAPAVVSEVRKEAPAAGKGKESALPAVVAKTAQGEIHVKTSGVTFDQKTGVVTTQERVEFSITQGAGSASGASYDSQKGLLILDRAVELSTKRGGESVDLRARHGEFERGDQVCRLSEATAAYRGGNAMAGEAKVLFREDGSVVRLDATDGFTLMTATGGRVAAPGGTMDFDERNRPRHGRMEGGVTIDTAEQMAAAGGQQDRKMHGASPSLDLEFNGAGQLRLAHLEKGVEIDSEVREESEGMPLLESRRWRSPVADVEFRQSRQGRMEPATIHGTGGVTITDQSRKGKGAGAPTTLSADEVTGEFAPGAQLAAMRGAGHVSLEETTAAGLHQSTSGDRLEAHFAPSQSAGTRPGQKAASGGSGQIQSATVDGNVVLVQTPSARAGAAAQPPVRATAAHAVYEGNGEWLHLTGSPRVDDGDVQVSAARIDVSRASGDAFAVGDVKATMADRGAKKDAGDRNASGLDMGGQGPVHMVAGEAQFHQASGEASFKGHARLWQQTNSITAPLIVLDRQKQTLAAHSADAAEPVRAVLMGSGASPAARGGPAEPAVIRLRGGELKYSGAERIARMRGGALGAVAAETGNAVTTSGEVELVLLPPGNHAGKEGAEGRVDRMTARGGVTVNSEGRRGTGEQLVYTSETGEYVLTGTAANPPRITDPARGTVTGEALIFHSRDESIVVEGGGRKTTTETTAPR